MNWQQRNDAIQDGICPEPPETTTQPVPFQTSGEVQALQAVGLFAPFGQVEAVVESTAESTASIAPVVTSR